MPFGLLVPAFLAGLAALLVPLILHLRRRDRRKPRPFPSLMFLQRLPVVTDRRRRLTDWPLLLVRALLLALLVLAFARPYRRQVIPPTGDAAGLTVVLIDRSQSMSHVDVRGAWRDSANAVIDALPPGRRVAVVAFDASASILTEATADHAAAKVSLAAAPAAAGGTRFGAGLRAAAQLLAGEKIPGEIVLISDFQRAGASSTSAPALVAGTVLRGVVVAPGSPANASVSDVDVQAMPAEVARRGVVSARVSRRGSESTAPVVARLEVDGRQVGQQSVAIPVDGSVRVTFDTVSLARGDARVVVRVDADALPEDDVAYAVVPAETAVGVMLVVPPGTSPQETRFLMQALEIGSDPKFDVRRMERLDRSALERTDVVMLYDMMPPDGDAGTALGEWVDQGNGLIVLAGERLAGRRGEVPLVPVTLRGAAESREGTGLGEVVTSHPALDAFRELGSEGFASVRVRRHAAVEASAAGTVLLRYDDGAPAVIARNQGTGRIMLTAIPMNTVQGDFPLRPAFLPFLRNVTVWAADGGPAPLSVESGEPWRVPGDIAQPVVRSAAGDVTRPTRGAGTVTLRIAGIHEVHDGRASGVPSALVAVNAPAGESDLTPMPVGELALGISDAPAATGAVDAGETPTVMEARQQGWRWVLLGVILLLAVEVWLASRGWRGIAAVQPATIGDGGGT